MVTQRAALAQLLVVEDDAVMRRAICGALDDAGFRTIECANLATARSALSRTNADVMILDLLFHDEFGASFLDELSSSARRPNVIVCSGFPLARIVAARHGAACVMKPFDLSHLIEQVERALAARASA